MANAVDVLTLAEAKRILAAGALDTTDEDRIAAVVTGCSQRLDELVGPVVQRTVTDERHDGGRCAITFRQGPAAAVTSIVEIVRGTATTLTAEIPGDDVTTPVAGTYLLDDYDHADGVDVYRRAVRRSGWSDSTWRAGRRNIVVTYTAGRFTATATVAERYKRAAGPMLINWYQQYLDSASEVIGGEYMVARRAFPGFAVPRATEQMLADQIRWPVA